ncbi:hypothetical protein CF336_g4938 [Tilletia laevis]|nr:hypothetical protein CF336_g4938 [Tilletia laevis]KAE8196555.1 hypothetical protein CF335_g4829 [Tilletia laevis]
MVQVTEGTRPRKSDPSKLVTGAGEIKPQGTPSQVDEDTSSPVATEDVFSEDDIDNEGGIVGLGLLSQVAARRAKRRYESDDEEDQDIDMDSSMSTPRASTTASSSKLHLPARSLPQMSRLIDASENDPIGQEIHREKDKEFLDRRMDAIINKLDVIHTQTTSNALAIAQLASSNAQAIAQLISRVDTFMNKVDMVAMILQHITPGSASGAMGRP